MLLGLGTWQLERKAWKEALIATFGGRGGGKPELAQGGGLDASPDVILDVARQTIEKH